MAPSKSEKQGAPSAITHGTMDTVVAGERVSTAPIHGEVSPMALVLKT